MAKALRRSLVRCCQKLGFRVCQFSIQRDHIHLVVEAANHEALARGMQGLAISMAKGINKSLDNRRGSVFRERYRTKPVLHRKQMRHVLCYVLHNHRRHGARTPGADPYSSARYFDGWSRATGLPPPGSLGKSDDKPVADAELTLLTTRWRFRGLIDPDETPPAALQ
jgi:REP element-mobilizing transposase RayT